MSPEFEKQILVAGVGNAWMLDDGFGSVVAQRLEGRDMPSGVKVMDAGSGGLDLAYEIMRGYHALVLVDVSRQGGEPGTLYVIEPDLDEIAPTIEDGDVINPHGMDPQTVLRFVRAVGGWSGKVVIVACEPGEVEDLGIGLSPALEAAVDQAIALVDDTVDERPAADARALRRRARSWTRCSGTRRSGACSWSTLRVGHAAAGGPGLARVLLGHRLARHARRGRAARARW